MFAPHVLSAQGLQAQSAASEEAEDAPPGPELAPYMEVLHREQRRLLMARRWLSVKRRQVKRARAWLQEAKRRVKAVKRLMVQVRSTLAEIE